MSHAHRASLSRTARASALTATLLVSLASVPSLVSSAAAAPYRSDPHDAKVVSVDGPGLLTVKQGRRTLALRLLGIDSPRAASPTSGARAVCGAAQATDALARMVAGRGVYLVRTYAVGADPRRPKSRQAVRDASGRLVANVAVLGKRRRGSAVLTLSGRLVRGGWARLGMPTSGTDSPIRGGLDALFQAAALAEEWPQSGPDGDGSLTNQGLWRLCGGRFHLPGGAPVPAFDPAPWAIDPDGVLNAIGGLPLRPAPQQPMPLAKVLEAFPGGELVTSGYGCMLWLPERGLSVFAFNLDALINEDRPPTTLDCESYPVVSAQTAGAGGVPTVAGGLTGGPASAFTAAYPQAKAGREFTDTSDRTEVMFLGPPSVLDAQADSTSRPRGLVVGDLDAKQARVVGLRADLRPLD